jgi:hypothetical protein
MTAPPPLAIEAVVHPVERPTLVAATRQLADVLSTASGVPYSIALRFGDALASVGRQEGRRAIIVASLQLEVPGRDEPLSETETRWRDGLSSLTAPDLASAFVCTIFRHVAGPDRAAIIERIRRLNLLAATLSHDTGVNVIDIDRLFALAGARKLQTDYRLGGPRAAEFAGHTIVAGILAAGLDDFFPPEIQERAKQAQGAMLERLKSAS